MKEFYIKHEIIINIIVVVLSFLATYSNGRRDQADADREALNEQAQKYQSLQEEYQEYKRNSYVLYGHD